MGRDPEDPATRYPDTFFTGGNWQERLALVVETTREISRLDDPQEVVRVSRERLARMTPLDGFLSVTRRGVEPPEYLIARSHLWSESVNPWTERDRLPRLRGGLLGELLYANEPRIIDDLSVAADDPAAEHFAGMRSLAAIPVYDHGEAKNLVVQMRREPRAFDRERLPLMVWFSNLFGHATHNLVLSRRLGEALAQLERQHQVVASIQESLLPGAPPEIPGFQVAAHTQASDEAGGDYHDFFPLPGGRLGILVADVTGHGVPATVIMAVTHALAHLYDGPAGDPAGMLSFLDRHLAARYTHDSARFVTAFHGVLDPAARTLRYSLAGHPPPRLRRGRSRRVEPLPQTRGMPLGIEEDSDFEVGTVELGPGDRLLIYTDGITEARDPAGTFFDTGGLDEVLAGPLRSAAETVQSLVQRLALHRGSRNLDDDVTLVLLAAL
jgi:sigma-B regulation protein RsbU (phosphoserine phosphatase)